MQAPESIAAFDMTGLAALRREARSDPKAAAANVARQFESLFLQIIMRSMREASNMGGNLFDSAQSKMYTGLLDQQMSSSIADGRGFGFAKHIETMLARQMPNGREGSLPSSASLAESLPLAGSSFTPLTAPGLPREVIPPLMTRRAEGSGPAASPSVAGSSGADRVPASAPEFVDQVWPHAVKASQQTGIPAHFMIGQSALETGWGQSQLMRADGRPSYNLFNIKAGSSWQGEVVETTATEYVNGKAVQSKERFRAYASYAEAFSDYARLMQQSPRYSEVLAQRDAAGFARSLQQAGYATDPAYASKLTRVIEGPTLRQALMG